MRKGYIYSRQGNGAWDIVKKSEMTGRIEYCLFQESLVNTVSNIYLYVITTSKRLRTYYLIFLSECFMNKIYFNLELEN